MRPVIRFTQSLSLLGFLLLPAREPAQACGGFFCSLFPVNQVAERILFVVGGGKVTTHVQLQYSGTASDFAWILPVPAVPELEVSHNEVFNQLLLSTQPSFVLEWQEDNGACGYWGPPYAATVEAGGQEDRNVNVVAQGRVGPYETAVLSSDDPQAVIDWLVNNGYQVDALGEELLAPYVEAGMYFLALRLAPDREIGDLQPIALTYDSQKPMIPIKLTAVATQPNLGVLVWILGEHRAIPENYLHVHINEARIDWFNGGLFSPLPIDRGRMNNYDQVVTEAMDEAGGQGFVTDYAGPSRIMDGLLYKEGRFDLGRLRQIQDRAAFVDELLAQGFPRDAQMQALLRRHMPIPEIVLTEGMLEVAFGGDREAYQKAVDSGQFQGIAESSFYNNIRAYERYLADLPFDPSPFVDELEAVVVTPLRQAQELFAQHPYLTRLYTTLSAEEMTVDPVFSFNPDLPEVSNVRTAQARWECPDKKPEEILLEELVLVVTLKDGREIRSRPFVNRPQPLPMQPAAALVEQLDESGPPQVISRMTAVEETSILPETFTLLPNYPNPFNAGTVVPFQLSATSVVSLQIYNLLGQPVRTLLAESLPAGYHQVAWDGRDDQGQELASGVYLYRLQAGNQGEKRKLVLLR